MAARPKLLNVTDIVAREDLCARSHLRLAIVREYAELFRNGDVAFPPVDVFEIDKQFILADGFHRYEAAKLAEMLVVRAELSMDH